MTERESAQGGAWERSASALLRRLANTKDANGIMPKIIANAVMMIGRNRNTPDVRMARAAGGATEGSRFVSNVDSILLPSHADRFLWSRTRD